MLSIIYDQSTSNMTYWTVFAEDKYREACSKSSTLNYKTHRITHFKLSLLSQAIFSYKNELRAINQTSETKEAQFIAT